jgi:hypothetical protein
MELQVQRCQVQLPTELIACHVPLSKTQLLQRGGWQGLTSFYMATDKINRVRVIQPVKWTQSILHNQQAETQIGIKAKPTFKISLGSTLLEHGMEENLKWKNITRDLTLYMY